MLMMKYLPPVIRPGSLSLLCYTTNHSSSPPHFTAPLLGLLLYIICVCLCPLGDCKISAHLWSLGAIPATVSVLDGHQIKAFPVKGKFTISPSLSNHENRLLFFFQPDQTFSELLTPSQFSPPKIKQNTPVPFPMEIRKAITVLTFNLQRSSWVLLSRSFIIFIRPRL